MGEILKIRVFKEHMKHFPFDVFYLVPGEHRKVIPQIFPWSLCTSIGDALAHRVMDLTYNETEHFPHAGRRITEKQGYRTSLTLPANWRENHFVVVPVLPMETAQVRTTKKRPFQKVKGKKVPGYIVAPKHAQGSVTHLPGILDDDTVLFTPRGPVRPVCTLCPRHFLHIQHKCELGSSYCFTELVLKRSANEQLQTDSAQSDSDSDEHPSRGAVRN